jgi:two-component system, NarL family, response regulator LiaR
MSVQTIRVLVADDYLSMRASLETFFAVYDDLELVGEAKNGREALDLCAQVAPDIVLMDILMPGMDGIVATRLIHERYPLVRIVVLTSAPENALIEDALEAGAVSCVLKTATIDELANSLRKAAQRPPYTLTH